MSELSGRAIVIRILAVVFAVLIVSWGTGYLVGLAVRAYHAWGRR